MSGGQRSTRRNPPKKTSHAIDLHVLAQAGLLDHRDKAGQIKWPNNLAVGYIFQARASAHDFNRIPMDALEILPIESKLTLYYAIEFQNRMIPLTVEIPISRNTLGGGHWWMHCPGPGPCLRRVRKLHILTDGTLFACRHCLEL